MPPKVIWSRYCLRYILHFVGFSLSHPEFQDDLDGGGGVDLDLERLTVTSPVT